MLGIHTAQEYPQVCQGSFAQSFGRSFKIQRIVDELKRLTDVDSIEVASALVDFIVRSQHSRGQAGVSYRAKYYSRVQN